MENKKHQFNAFGWPKIIIGVENGNKYKIMNSIALRPAEYKIIIF